MKRAKRKPPIGTSWRILAGGIGLQPRIDMRSSDHPVYACHESTTVLPKRTTFDELVISGLIHIEQMDARTYYVCLGEEKRMVWVDRKGKVHVGEMFR